MRESGYYRVQYHPGEWTVGFWSAEDLDWDLSLTENYWMSFEDSDLCVIGARVEFPPDILAEQSQTAQQESDNGKNL